MKELMNQAIVLGGLTIAKVNGKPQEVRFTKGYQVAKTGISFTDLDEALDKLERLADELQEGDDWFIGLWHDNGTLYIEPSYYIDDRDYALKLGKYYGQLAIYDWSINDSITIEGGKQ